MAQKTLSEAVSERLLRCGWATKFHVVDKAPGFVEASVEWSEPGLKKIRLLYDLLHEAGYLQDGTFLSGEIEFLASLAQKYRNAPEEPPQSGLQTPGKRPRY